MAVRTARRKKLARRVEGLALLLGTVKGAFVLVSRDRRRWRQRGPYFLGERVHDFRLDPRDGRTLLATAAGGHLGPTIQRSTDGGASWSEARRPPRFRKAANGRPKRSDGSRGQTVKLNLWLTPGHADEPGAWYCGTSPQGLFLSADGGDTWSGVRGFNEGPEWHAWTDGGTNGTPDGPFLHSILVDPRDARHLYVSLSMGGTFESRDRGRSWRPLNRGVATDFQPERYPEYGQDPHCTILHPADPDRLYQQNHCGIYRLDRAAGEDWVRIGARAQGRRRHRLPDRRPSARSRHGVGLPDGRQERLAAHEPGREARRLSHARRGAQLGASRRRLAGAGGVVHGPAPGDGRRRRRALRAGHRPLLRHDLGRGVGELRRGRELELRGAAPAAHPLAARGALAMIVHLGSILHAYTRGRAEIAAEGRTLGAVLDDLERRFPGLRFRIVDEQERIRPHFKIWIGGAPARRLTEKVPAGCEVHVLGALSGG